MRDPMSWALPVGRAFGVPVKVHLFFFVITLGLFLRQIGAKDNPVWWLDVLLFTVVLLFFVVLLHELGHCFGARAVDGDAREILIWPLGGLAYVEVPHTARANFIATVAGPLVNVMICLGAAAALVAAGFLPNANPLASPYVAEVHSYRDGRDYTAPYGLRLYYAGTADPMAMQEVIDKLVKDKDGGLRDKYAFRPQDADQMAKSAGLLGGERAVAPGWVVWTQRAFWLSWVMLLFNLIPAYPLDGGQMLMAVIWGRSGSHRRGVTVAAYSGFVVSVLFLLASVAANESLFMGLALFMLYSASMRLAALDADDGGAFGYDFSAGYTSLGDDDPPRKRKRPGFLTRWRQARTARRLQKEAETRAQDDLRMDELLEKIARTGKDSLTADERRFLERLSARKRNLS